MNRFQKANRSVSGATDRVPRSKARPNLDAKVPLLAPVHAPIEKEGVKDMRQNSQHKRT